jgi:hypothetical protein
MRLDRILIAVPLIGGALLTGSAAAHVIGISPTVRDFVYPASPASVQRCQHNGVHYNKQGHANCGLHKGWGGDTTDTNSTTDTTAPQTTHGHAHRGNESPTHGRSTTHGNSGTHGPGHSGGHKN